MPYLLLVLGLLIAGYVLYQFLMQANAAQVRSLVLTILLIAIGLGAFILAITGRLPAAIALIAACVPFGMKYLKNRRARQDDVSTIIEVEGEEIEDDTDKD